ncbi:unnamed protein product [Bemisia tabaci]|uniref:Cadherin domain-containing protein n=1 Tax=Bemisia tabaci TaxID=7038 RepID=A0A9P0A9V8_BEMTA|nr:unnamed protein product [Bemisia tabaci]
MKCLDIVLAAALALCCPLAAASTPAAASPSPPPEQSSTPTVLPHDLHPGYSVEKFDTRDQFLNFRLLETGFSQFFTVLDNGMLMTTSDLTPLVNRPVKLVVLEESPNSTAVHTLQLYVMDRHDMIAFPVPSYDAAHVPENEPPNTRVLGIPPLQATGHTHGPVKYSIVAGNTNDSFRLRQVKIPAFNDSAYGVQLVTSRPLDRETQAAYTLTVQATDARGIDTATVQVHVDVEDVNDNAPVFSQKVYRFVVGGAPAKATTLDEPAAPIKRFAAVGRVSATDADGDRVAYRMAVPSKYIVIVPQTGDLILATEPTSDSGGLECELTIEAHDLRTPTRFSRHPAQVWVEFNIPSLEDEEELQLGNVTHHIEKRRVTRAVRPTKRIEFSEADGAAEGCVFQLEKETERESFKIRDENQWVHVEANGTVCVKKKWDYEELGQEKTIDFWVTITNSGNNGESPFSFIVQVLTFYE